MAGVSRTDAGRDLEMRVEAVGRMAESFLGGSVDETPGDLPDRAEPDRANFPYFESLNGRFHD